MRRLRERLVRTLPPGTSDNGHAVVEYLGGALVLLIPTVYLVLVLARLQAAAFAVDGAAREAVRVASAASGLEPHRAASAAAGIALADQGLDRRPDVMELRCPDGCSSPGSRVSAHVEVDVPLPGVPSFIQSAVPLRIPVSASARGTVAPDAGRP